MSLGYDRPWAEQLNYKLYRDKLPCDEDPACDYHTISERRWTMMVANHYEFFPSDSVARRHYLYSKWTDQYYDLTSRFNISDLDV